MKADAEFADLHRSFWAHVRLVSERIGYSLRERKSARRKRGKKLRRYSLEDVLSCLKEAQLKTDHILDPESNAPTLLGVKIVKYLNFRAELLEKSVEPNLMDRSQAKSRFLELKKKVKPTCALPMNKQKGKKRHYAYMTCMVNMLTCQALGSKYFADSPRGLSVVTRDGYPLRTFSRWMDGAYPSEVDPHAVWEVKEYYGTTTFGSRVADGVYETMLDGEEMEELRASEKQRVLHYLIVDDRYTWWDCGRSYLCRIIDMLHMGLVDEVVFGREVLSRWPEIVKEWP